MHSSKQNLGTYFNLGSTNFLLRLVLLIALSSINFCTDSSAYKLLAEYSVTSDEPVISGMQIIPIANNQILKPKLYLRDERMCVASEDLINFGIQLAQQPQSNLIAIEMQLYFDQSPDEILLEFFYSSITLKHFESQITKRLIKPKSKQWFTLRLWLPNFKWLDHEKNIAHLNLDRPLSIASLGSESKFRKTLTEIPNLYLSSFKIIEYQEVEEQNILSRAHQKEPSILENSVINALSWPILLISIVALVIGFRSRLIIKFLAGLTCPFIILLLFFNTQNIPLIKNIEESEYQNLLTELQSYHQHLKLARQSSELMFQKKLNKNRKPLDDALEKDLLQFGKPNERFKSELQNLAKNIGGNLLVHSPHKGQTYTSNKKMHNYTRRKQFLETMFWPYADLLLRSTDNQFQSVKQRMEELDQMIKFNQLQKIIEESFSSSLGIRQFFYKPEKLGESLVIDFDITQMFLLGLKDRVFWTWYEDTINQDKWVYTGYIERKILLKQLETSLQQLLDGINQSTAKSSQNVTYFLSGFDTEPDIEPITLQNREHFERVSQLSRSQDNEVFVPVIENNELRFYYANKLEVIEHYVLCVSISGREYLERVKNRKNQLIYIALLILAVVLALSFFMSFSVTQPFEILKRGMDRITRGEFDHDLPIRGSNQFARCATAFNEMLLAMREKEFISQFVSRMALSNLTQQSDKTRKELVTMMYCAIPDLEYLMENLSMQEAVETLNQCLRIIQNQVVKFGGSVDKFTGHASLCVFVCENSSSQPIEAAISIRNKMTEWNLKRSRAGKKPLTIAIGIARGQVIMGHIGSEKRKDYTCIGDTVNMAARLGSMRFREIIHTQILLDENLVISENIQQSYSISKHADISVKGKQLKQVLYELD